ncbi:hypothetical protein [Pseudomonas sp. Pseusp16]|uniref:hypothetical protein n=1 Tax=Pseudomonas sp. Pseusp16 TaxID=3243021 RepID=UPI0039B39C2C
MTGIETCGSGLAHDSSVSANINVDWKSVIAGKPAPTGLVAVIYGRLCLKYRWLILQTTVNLTETVFQFSSTY